MHRFDVRLRVRIPEILWRKSIGGRLNASAVAEWIQANLIIGFDLIAPEAIEVIPVPDDE